MIDPAARAERLAEEAADPAVGVLLIDVVLGYASHPDPAGVLVPVIREALAARPQLAVVGYVLGTEADPQVRSRQEEALAAAGVRLAPTNAAAARLAAALCG
jgi:FdrA protein